MFAVFRLRCRRAASLFYFWWIRLMVEGAPDTENVVYIDEYPELKKRVWLRRLAQERAGQLAVTDLIIFPDRNDPDGAA
jgi:hypothetical protein